MKKVAILGSTGSIGTQTLSVIRENADKLKVFSLVAFSNGEKLQSQCAEFHPEFYALIAESGEQCLIDAVRGADVAVVATRGIAALKSVLYCLENGVDVALANKETLVCGGELVTAALGKSKAKLIPVDSEHCAIWQCLAGKNVDDVDKILLTASGGPFRNVPSVELREVSAEDALAHPTWNMGSKITIDSATMFNKALEVMEARWLFGVQTDKIQIVVHPQSVVHSMVQWKSGSISAQLAVPDMKLPIQLALLGESYCNVGRVNFDMLNLSFFACDVKKFPCANLGYEMEKYPPLGRTIINAANDVCVENFLSGRMRFDAFYTVIKKTADAFCEIVQNLPVTVENIEKYHLAAKKMAQNFVNEVSC